MSTVHETSVIDPAARIGENVTIGPFCHIGADVEIGEGCVLHGHVTLMGRTTLGPGCSLHAGAVLGDTPQDLGFTGGETYLRVGANCKIREGVTLHRGTKPGTATEIGDDCFLMAYAHCAHNVKLGKGVIMANGALLAGYVEVGDRVFISGNSSAHQFVKIGRLAMLGGGCGATKDVPPFCTLRPFALNQVEAINVVGMRRAGMSLEERQEVKRVFKILYKSGLNVAQAAEEIRRSTASGPGLEFLEFIGRSTRGIC